MGWLNTAKEFENRDKKHNKNKKQQSHYRYMIVKILFFLFIS